MDNHEGFELAKKEFQEKSIRIIKEVTLKTLEKIDSLDKQINKLQEEKKILKLDLEDLKLGNLEKIQERQESDETSRKASVIIVIKEKETVRDYPYHPPYTPWYQPWNITWTAGNTPFTSTNIGGGYSLVGNGCSHNNAVINCSLAKDGASGTYKVSGHTVHFR
jgi:regulator of replication initiation timing